MVVKLICWKFTNCWKGQNSGEKSLDCSPVIDVRLEFSKMEHLTKLERERSNKVGRKQKEILTRKKKIQTKQKELELLEKKLRETRINN